MIYLAGLFGLSLILLGVLLVRLDALRREY